MKDVKNLCEKEKKLIILMLLEWFIKEKKSINFPLNNYLIIKEIKMIQYRGLMYRLIIFYYIN